MPSLTPAQIEQFHDQGYVIAPDIFTSADLKPLQDELTAVIDREARRLIDEGRPIQLHADADFEHRLALIAADDIDAGKHIAGRIMGRGGGGHKGREMFNLLAHPSLLDAVASLVGPDVVASSVYRIRVKMPQWAQGEVPWHQDSGYFAKHCDDNLIVTCWVPLVDATVHNGCMRIQPAGHRGGIVRHHTGGHSGFLEIKADDLPVPADDYVVAEAPAGSVVMMTNFTPHMSTPNHSDVVRWATDLRYQAAGVPNNLGLWPDAEEGAPDGDAYQVACYPPEADFLVRSSDRPGEAIATYEAYLKRRSSFDANPVPFKGRGWSPMPT